MQRQNQFNRRRGNRLSGHGSRGRTFGIQNRGYRSSVPTSGQHTGPGRSHIDHHSQSFHPYAHNTQHRGTSSNTNTTHTHNRSNSSRNRQQTTSIINHNNHNINNSSTTSHTSPFLQYPINYAPRQINPFNTLPITQTMFGPGFLAPLQPITQFSDMFTILDNNSSSEESMNGSESDIDR